MKSGDLQKAFTPICLALVAVGGFGVWALLGLDRGVTSHQTVPVKKLSAPTDENLTVPTPFITKKGPETPSSGPQIIAGVVQPKIASDQNSFRKSKPPLGQLAELLEAARRGMARSTLDELFGRWLSTLGTGEMLAALNFLPRAGLEDSLFADLNSRLIRRLSETDINLAMGAVNAMPEGAARVLASENLAAVWADEQLSTAINWAVHLPTGPEREHDLFAVTSEAVRIQPTEALRLVDELLPGTARDELVSRAVGEWAVADPVAATSWSTNIADDTLREQALASATTAWSDRDPAAAGAFALAELSPGRIQDDAVVGVAQRWAQQSPAAAAAWVQSFPEGGLKTAAASSVASIWKRSNAPDSEQWLAQIIGP